MLWIPEFRYWISDILSMEFSLVEFRLQRPRFRIAQAKISLIQESGLPSMGRKLSSSLFTTSVIRTIAWKKIKKREYRQMPSPYFPQNLHLSFSKRIALKLFTLETVYYLFFWPARYVTCHGQAQNYFGDDFFSFSSFRAQHLSNSTIWNWRLLQTLLFLLLCLHLNFLYRAFAQEPTE